MSVNIAQTSEVIGTVQEKSPAGRPTSGSLPAGTGREPHIPNQYGMLHGYKFMHLKCIQAGLVVTQTTIRHLLIILDPQGVQLRKRNGLP